MENEAQDASNSNTAQINSFCEITSTSKEEALFFLESHQWNLDAAVSTFLDDAMNPTITAPVLSNLSPNQLSPSASPSLSGSPDYAPSQSDSPPRSRSPSPAPSRGAYILRPGRGGDKKPARAAGSRSRGGVRTLADLDQSPRDGSGSDSDEPQQYYTGGEKSGMLVQDPTKGNDVDAIFSQARQAGGVERPADHFQPSSSSNAFIGTARRLSGETVSYVPQPPEAVNHVVTFWRNGFTIDDGPLRRLDDPQNALFLESIKNSECPQELVPADRRTRVSVDLVRRNEDYSEPERRSIPFQGAGRTLGSSTSTDTPPASSKPNVGSNLKTAPLPSAGLIVDLSSPATSIQIRLADGTRMVSRFNYHHTIRDIHAFIDASRIGGARHYQLQTMGFPPKQLTDWDETIEQAGVANSVVIQKFS
ncbi:hypothetical protein HS088_TW22G00143 [Tripterygium wilfordii]|uniref:Plant UBX domain-containing protein 4-like n=1 Tax=Tripterygium wilfordii TaxID=458696 RepID=A0A7J7BXP0_TRIWF|nr:plant UBX domain-containing protein 4-like [Tripterygium wilfordii]KAF5726465.1 hypothetical protein HS088_TW22G00143 [Tripterygium wilfordii]